MNMKNIYLSVFILLVLFIVTGCTSTTSDPNKEKIKIGIMTITTGDLAFLGQNIVRSAELAKAELGYDNVEFIVEDVGNLGDGSNTVAAYRKLVDIDQVQIIIDGMTSDSTMVVAPLLVTDKVVMITPLTGGANIDAASEYLFRNGPSDVLAGKKPAEDLYNKFGYKKVILLTDNAEYTLDISKTFRQNYQGEIVIDELISPSSTDYRNILTKIQSKDFDAIIINTATGQSAGYLIKQLYELKNTKPIFVNFIGYGSNPVSIAGASAFEGVYVYDAYYDANYAETQSFLKGYELTYNTAPPIPFHSTGTYDDVKMLVEAVNSAGYDGELVRDYLLDNINNWRGLNGNVTFDANGNVESGFVLKQVQNGSLVLVEK